MENEKKKVDFAEIAGGIGKGTTQFLNKAKNKAVSVMDRDGNGKVNLSDASFAASAVGNSVKKAATAVKENVAERRLDREGKKLQPIFEEMVSKEGFTFPKLIRLCEKDKKRTDSEVCQGAVGYFTDHRDCKLVNVFYDYIDKMNVTFFPDSSYEFYYVDPRVERRYIALDEYFDYLKVERINELQRVAQELGAKHFRVTYKEEKEDFTHQKKGVSAKLLKDSMSRDTDVASNNFAAVEVAAEMDFPGHAPSRPTLCYLKNDSSIENLIAMRMDEKSPLTHQVFLLKMSNSLGIKESDAAKIDSVLKGVKSSVEAKVCNEVKKESRRYLQYEIDF